MFGPGEWLLVGAIAVLVFGVTPFVKVARGLGQGVSEFKKGLRGGEEDPEEETPPLKPQADEREEGQD